MIRSFGHYGIVEKSLSRTVIARRRPLIFTVHAHSHAYRARVPSLSTPSLVHARLLSDTRTTTKPKPSSTAEPAPPPVNPPRKAKVELRPAPVRPTQTQPQHHLQQQPAPTKPLPESQAKPHLEHAEKQANVADASKQLTPESFSEMTRADVKYAQTHGVLAPPPPDANVIGRFWHQAKELFKFYFRGMKLVYTHRVQAQEMLKRVKTGGPPLSRWEARFIARSRSDIKKLVPFVMIVLVIEEIIPLIVLYAPWMLPSTCLLPSQRERIEKKRREKQAATVQVMSHDLRGIIESADGAGGVALKNLRDKTQLIALCGALSLSTFGPPPVRARRIEQHLSTIVKDDALLKVEGMGTRLTQPELIEALEERGILTIDVDAQRARERLAWWLREVDAGPAGDAVGRRVVLVARSGLREW